MINQSFMRTRPPTMLPFHFHNKLLWSRVGQNPVGRDEVSLKVHFPCVQLILPKNCHDHPTTSLVEHNTRPILPIHLAVCTIILPEHTEQCVDGSDGIVVSTFETEWKVLLMNDPFQIRPAERDGARKTFFETGAPDNALDRSKNILAKD